MRKTTLFAASLAVLALSGCGEDTDAGETYGGSRQVPVAVSIYVPEGDPVQTMSMAGKVPIMIEQPGTPPMVSVAFKGSGVFTYRLPRDCPAGAVELRQGRMMRMRVDRWRQPDGSTVERLPPDEVADALCRHQQGRDLPASPGIGGKAGNNVATPP